LFSVDLAPARNDEGAMVTWLSRAQQHRQVDFSYFHSNTQLLQGKLALTTATLSYTQRITQNTNIVGSVGEVATASNGTSDRHPVFMASLQHRFYSAPSFLLPGRHGIIQGHVFRDDDATAVFRDQPVISEVEVRLDDQRVTHTDARGFYAFRHVPYGVHRVEAKMQSADPFYYTTDSPATTDINNTVDFGVNFAKGQVFGYVINDAGAGIGNVAVELRGEKFTRRAITGGSGKFSFPGLPAGTYTVTTVPESYPAGYSLQALEQQQAVVDPGQPASVKFSAKAMRSISGKVLVYDNQALKTVPFPGATVHLKELSLEAKTGENGAFIFRSLPAGTYTIVVEHQGKEITRQIVLPTGPANIRDIELNAGTK
ncbi:MAG TPA: carboxypeptidase regulatory-like domain-containing protein, partial [Terriglobales bacterium]|nr:carboxypeptidase regulatory-like domain-containing protein [Terriglobales bacterium]